MAPRTSQSLTSSFPLQNANNEVVCPLRNQDGSSCRKRCLGEKRYRSMQEHIRRAHPEHYIPKLPATEESFLLMVNMPPSERPKPPPPPPQQQQPPPPVQRPSEPSGYPQENYGPYYPPTDSYPDLSGNRSSDEFRRGSLLPAASAAAALAQLHNQNAWGDSEVRPPNNHHHQHRDTQQQSTGKSKKTDGSHHVQERYSDEEKGHGPRPNTLGYEGHMPKIKIDHNASQSSPTYPAGLLPSGLPSSPPGRSSTLPPLQRTGSKMGRPRKPSLSKTARLSKHERQKSKEQRRMSYERKAFSAEPGAANSEQRWLDLIEAAASATEEDSRDLTPVPTSPRMKNRTSLPPFAATQFQQIYHNSPLQKTLTPPPPDATDMQAFPSVESSIDSNQSGANFHMNSQGLADSSPQYMHPVQIYCAACRRLASLKDSYACTECICGICQDCVDALVAEQNKGRPAVCPRCRSIGGRFKPFQLDIR